MKPLWLLLALLPLALALSYLFPRPLGEVELRIATTTSILDSGLLEPLLAAFEELHSQIRVKAIAKGTGLALEMARRGDADLVITHSPSLEEEFVKEGYGLLKAPIMYNDFLLLGPPHDPAGARGLGIMEALRRVALAGDDGRATFFSRGDRSGTHIKELELWNGLGLRPQGRPWYREVGAGQLRTLLAASEAQAYVLTDRGTWLSHKRALKLDVLVEGDPLLLNIYSVMLVNPAKNPRVNFKAAEAFALFLLSPTGQGIIDAFRIDGEPLFHPITKAPKELPIPRENLDYWLARVELAEAKAPKLGAPGRLLLSVAEVFEVTILSLLVSGTSTLLGAAIGLPLGAYLALGGFRGRGWITSIVHTAMALPPVLVGLLVYLLLSSQGPFAPLNLLFTPHAMILAQLILVLPIIAGLTHSAISQVSPKIRELALALGADRRQVGMTVLREASPALATALLAAFGRAIAEVGAIMMVGGAIRHQTWTLTVAIFQSTSRGEIPLAVTLGLVLLLVSYAVNLAVLKVSGARPWSR